MARVSAVHKWFFSNSSGTGSPSLCMTCARMTRNAKASNLLREPFGLPVPIVFPGWNFIDPALSQQLNMRKKYCPPPWPPTCAGGLEQEHWQDGESRRDDLEHRRFPLQELQCALLT